MQRNWIIASVFLFLLPISGVSGQEVTSPSLQMLHQAVAKLVQRHYPKATSYVFEQTIGFEYSTRMYVTQVIAKRPLGTEPLLAPERGPMGDGVWCEIWCRSGDLLRQPVYARSEGVTKREFFREHVYYPSDGQKECHLIVTLRMPLETRNDHTKFVKDLRGLLNQFGNYLPAKDE